MLVVCSASAALRQGIHSQEHEMKKHGVTRSRETVVMSSKRVKGSVGEGEAGKKAKVTQHVGGQSVSEKSQTTRTSKNVFEKSNSNLSSLVTISMKDFTSVLD